MGQQESRFDDLYARLLGAHWGQIALAYFVCFFVINLIFAGLYYVLAHTASGSHIENARPEGFEDYFFFSVQTLATIGYGAMSPKGVWVNLVVSFEALTGMGIYALLTGVVFARFSRPTARVRFSEMAVINTIRGHEALSFRLVNDRGNRIVDARASVHMLKDEILPDGSRLRRMHDLKLERARMPILQLSWSLYHPIDAQSPLKDMSYEAMIQDDIEILVTLTGHDETLASTIHARYSYLPEDIVREGIFEDLIERTEKSGIRLHYDRLNRLKSPSPGFEPRAE